MARSDGQGLEQRFDRWVETGRQLVDGVAGARPGGRSAARGSGRRPGSRLNPGELGRWVEDKLEWLLDDEADDDWREPWQPPVQSPQPVARTRSGGRRRPLEAISRRGGRSAPAPAPSPAGAELMADWPDDGTFSISRWQRQAPSERRSLERGVEPLPEPRPDLGPSAGAARPLPRSSRLLRR